MSVFLASSIGNDRMEFRSLWYLWRMVFEICFVVLALFLLRPATFKHSSISFSLAFASASGVILDLFEKFSKALAAFLPAVFCEIIVTISVLKGSSLDAIQFWHVEGFLKYF